MNAQLTLTEALNQAIEAHKAGKLKEAEGLYRAILEALPNHPDANHNLGVIAITGGKLEAGLALLKTALESNPQQAQFWISYVDALIAAGKPNDAKSVLMQGKNLGLQGEEIDHLEERLQKSAELYSETQEVKRQSLTSEGRLRGSSRAEAQNDVEQEGVTLAGEVPTGEEIAGLLQKYNSGLLEEAGKIALAMTQSYPSYPFAWKTYGAILGRLGRLEESLEAIQKVIRLNPFDAAAHLNLGITFNELGRVEEAEASFREAIRLQPGFVEAHNSIANIFKVLGRFEEAEAGFREAIRLRPEYAVAHNNLGMVLSELGRYFEAETHYRKAINLNPKFAEALCNLGHLQKRLGQFEEAEKCYREAICLKPTLIEAHNNLGNLLLALGEKDAAVTHYLEVIRLNSDYWLAHCNLGNALLELGRLTEAENSYREAIRLKPDFVEARNNLGNVLLTQGRTEEAERCYEEVIRLRPDYAAAYYNLGNLLLGLGKYSESESNYCEAIRLKPDYAEAYSNLGAVRINLNRLAEAEISCREAIRLQPHFAKAHNNLGNALLTRGRLDEAGVSYRYAIQLQPDYFEAYSNLLFSLNYIEALPILKCLEEARHFGAQASVKAKPKYSDWSINFNPEKLRIGFVSGDLGNHPVGYFLEGLVKEIDRNKVELAAYSTTGKSDELTQRIRPFFKDWVSIEGVPDQEAARLIHANAHHILIDLSGHTAHNRLPVFAYKPAPIQVTWLGYFATTGLPEIDYILANPYVIPTSEEWHFTEKVWRLPETSLCFTPPEFTVSVSNLPALANGHITFGCFNSLTKMNEAVISAWAEILKRVPHSRLFLKTRQFSDPKVVEDVLAAYAKHDILRDRLVLEGASNREEYLLAYNRVDIALDPFPFPGGTTSIEGIWMGVPVLTVKGDRFISHQGEAIASNIGLSEWISEDVNDYVDKAVRIAEDIQSLVTLRGDLRSRLLSSPLCHSKRFARYFEDAMWGMWNETHREALKPSLKEINDLLAYYNSGDFESTERKAKELTHKFPKDAFGWKALGVSMIKTGRFHDSLTPLRKSILLAPTDVEAHSNLGNSLREIGLLEEAEASCREAIRIKPDFSEAHNNLGVILRDLKRVTESEASCREAIRLNPGYVKALNNLGNALSLLGRHEESEKCYREALQIEPGCAEILCNLGIALKSLRRLAESEAIIREAILIKPDYAKAYSDLGATYQELGLLTKAEASYRKATELNAQLPVAHNNFGNTLLDLGRHREAELSYREAIRLKANYSEAHSNLLFCLNYIEALPVKSSIDEARSYGTHISNRATPKYFSWNTISNPEKIKIGLVSGDLINHPVGYFLEGLVKEIDRDRFELVSYSTTPKIDELTRRINPYFKDSVFIGGISDYQAAQLIHEQAPQILIDLAGHTANNRLPVFAYKPAPVQVTWLGYFATTGLPEVNYILANPYVIPKGEEWHFSEEVWRLPHTSLCFTPPDITVDVASLPALANRFITFGCFNTLAKMNDRVISVWSEILKRVTGSRLFLKAKQFADPMVVAGVVAAYAKYGISKERIILEGPSSRSEYLTAYNLVDIALDPFPFPGGTTSVEGLWMGVPVLTLKGDRFISHQGEAIVHNVGLSEWIADGTQEYVDKAVRFSEDIQSLALLRNSLRERLLNSPLCDAKRFARHFEEAMWGMWSEYQKSKAS